MNRRGLELLTMAALFAGAAAFLLIAQLEEPETEPAEPADPDEPAERPRGPAGRCPNCSSFVKKAEPREHFSCKRCGARLFQESADITVVEA